MLGVPQDGSTGWLPLDSDPFHKGLSADQTDLLASQQGGGRRDINVNHFTHSH